MKVGLRSKEEWKQKMSVETTKRERERLKKRVEDEKKKKEGEEGRERRRSDRLNTPAPRGPSKSPSKAASPRKVHQEAVTPTSTRKRGRPFIENKTEGIEAKRPRLEVAGPSGGVTGEGEGEKKRRGRPLGWRAGDGGYKKKGKSTTTPVVQQPTTSRASRTVSKSPAKKMSPLKAVRKSPVKGRNAKREMVNSIKRKYQREVTPIREKEVKGVGTRRKAAKVSPMKTRALQKKNEKEEKSLVPRCVMCRSKKGDLFKCAECDSHYHLRKCCRYSESAASFVERGGRKRWLCARCTACALCNEYISDPQNVECVKCTMTYHGKCVEKGGRMDESGFTCNNCTKLESPKKGKEKKEEVKRPRIERTVPKAVGTKRLVKGWEYIGVPLDGEEEVRRVDERDTLYDNMVGQVTNFSKNPNSPCKYGAITSPQKLKKFALQADIDLFESAKAALAAEKNGKAKKNLMQSYPSDDLPCSSASRGYQEEQKGQWVYVGSKKHKMKSIYSSPYPTEIAQSPNVYICPFCLRANNNTDMFRIHQIECTWSCPPGNEIYRDTERKISFFEVDGAQQKLYCRRVCLLGKLFISSKTLVDEVETFLFYVLVEHTADGAEFVGYFSKEKNPSKNNNLSCILTLPSAMKSGYGRLLIDLSYELSRVERKIGSPEHPLSDLGLIAYRGFWRSSILCYLRSLRGTHVASIKQISLATRISPQDVINQLMRDGLLFYKDGVYYVNTEQRAYRMPLAMTRRKTIDHSKLKWTPDDPNYEQLDSSRLNYYV